MEKHSQKLREDQFRQLLALLKQERRDKEELVRQVARLELENQTLKRAGSYLKQKLERLSPPSPRKQ